MWLPAKPQTPEMSIFILFSGQDRRTVVPSRTSICDAGQVRARWGNLHICLSSRIRNWTRGSIIEGYGSFHRAFPLRNIAIHHHLQRRTLVTRHEFQKSAGTFSSTRPPLPTSKSARWRAADGAGCDDGVGTGAGCFSGGKMGRFCRPDGTIGRGVGTLSYNVRKIELDYSLSPNAASCGNPTNLSLEAHRGLKWDVSIAARPICEIHKFASVTGPVCCC